jgi:hypothetical protein
MQLDSSNKSLKDLRQLCKDNNIVGYSNKNKQSLIDLINNQNTINQNSINNNNNNNDNELNN